MKNKFIPRTHISIEIPVAIGEKLLFRVFNHAAFIGYARLSKVSTQASKPANAPSVQEDFHAYELKMIEVFQNYRRTGVGTTLLQEVINFCQANRIGLLSGDIKSDEHTLHHWYRNNGFAVDTRGHIELSPALAS